MPSLVGNYITANYLKTKPSTRFSTRQLAFLRIAASGMDSNYEDSDSLFTKVVRGVQLVAEVYAVGTPNGDNVVVVVAADTNASHAEINGMAQDLSTQLSNGGISANVHALGLYGDSLLSFGSPSEYGAAGNPSQTGLRPPYEDEQVGRYD